MTDTMSDTNIKRTLAQIATGCALIGLPLWVGATVWMLFTTWQPVVYATVSTPALVGLAFAWLATYQGWDDPDNGAADLAGGGD